MKARSTALFIVVGLFALIASLSTAAPMAAQTQGTDNLLFNPGFEAGHHHQDGVPELTVSHWPAILGECDILTRTAMADC